ncbi:C40 family peptidase [Paenibacillus sp. ACRRX]|uniref:C40 family peptidase n=1 Tax=Paenibacillus sp. ACRRX TaxID=2918206 RepID=UPI001EF7377D|nr:C40 family peptidase [Paenibacillus sp. ACRRX]MCG7407145.1 C40 family peptidase [Paenibacillus sp. ACRRX]
MTLLTYRRIAVVAIMTVALTGMLPEHTALADSANSGSITSTRQTQQTDSNTEAQQTQATYTTNTYTAQAASNILRKGEKYLGTRYVFGAKSFQTRSFDCSSLVQYLFNQEGVDLPRTSYEQAKKGTHIKRSALQKGDLIFFSSGRPGKGKITHVAIYAGNNKILHTFGKPGVTYSNLNSDTWSDRYVTARRVLLHNNPHIIHTPESNYYN